MFIRVKKASHSSNKVVVLVESYRDENGHMKQRMLKHVGTARNEAELNSLLQTAEIIKIQFTQQALINKTSDAVAKLARGVGTVKSVPSSTRLHPSSLVELYRKIIGIHDIYGYLYDFLDFPRSFPNPRRNIYAAKILKEIVLARIAKPSSKRASVAMLEQDFGVKLNLDHVYQMMDKIDELLIDRIQERALGATLKLTGGKLKVLFYDATTLYFESFTEDELKQNGYSKDLKFNQPQLLLALFVTQEGLPVGYELFPGSTYEGHTLKPVLEKLKKRYHVENMILVADRGMLSQDNLSYLEEQRIPYIVGARLRNLSKATQNKILAWDHDKDFDRTSLTVDQRTLILSYSKKRATKDQADREKAITKLYQKLSKSKNPKTIVSNYGYQKYVTIEGDAQLTINKERLVKESQWDGLSGIFTHQQTLDPEAALAHYRSLWQVEESFRITKHDLRIRPIYHWTPKRVKAHVAISFMAFACVRYLEHRVKTQYKKMSPNQIRQTLLTVQASVLEDRKNKKRYLLPSSISLEARMIYKIFGIKLNRSIKSIV